jgi:hypothetical protein
LRGIIPSQVMHRSRLITACRYASSSVPSFEHSRHRCLACPRPENLSFESLRLHAQQ